MMKGIRLVKICKNLRNITSQNFPTSHINHTACKVCLISPGTDLPGEWALLALGLFPRTFETDFTSGYEYSRARL